MTIFDARLKKIRDVLDFRLSEAEAKKNLLVGIPLIAVTGNGFFVNCGTSGSEIAAYDLDGQLIRRIRAPFSAVKIQGEAKKALSDRIPNMRGYEPVRMFIKEQEIYPRFQALFADDSGRLFVAGTETDPASGANICDVFSPDGVLIFRTALGYQNLLLSALLNEPVFGVVFKKDRCYCLREKADGFKEVVVYTMRWQ